MSLKEIQAVMDADKPAFEYTRNLLAVITYWTVLTITWVLTGVGTPSPDAFPPSVYRFFLIVPCIFGVYLIVRIVRLTRALLEEIGAHLETSEWWIIRKLSFAFQMGGMLGMSGFGLLLSFNLIPPVVGIAKVLYGH
ncbi:hypothetical protein [Mesorhizobium sp. M1378]|uniref:hypothetical protein n=1 Tax=Mesorhizobium sp. M1378 TaxID=2957092 RepID=UPI00333693F7